VFESDLIMSGPTEILQVLQAAASRANKAHISMTRGSAALRYTVLLIVTDGVMKSEAETRRKLDVYKELPLSVIIVGIGRSSFESIQRLCEDKQCATFVDFLKHQHTSTAFGHAALSAPPTDICQYMHKHRF